MIRVGQEIDNGQECLCIHTCFLAGFSNGLVAKAQSYAKSANHLQHAIVITNDIAHRVVLVISSAHILPVLRFKVTKNTLFAQKQVKEMRLGRPKITCFEYCGGDKKGITLQPKTKVFLQLPTWG